MKKERLLELAGVQLNESNDETMFNEELKDIVSAIFIAWDRAKSLKIDHEEFTDIVMKQAEGSLQDLED